MKWMVCMRWMPRNAEDEEEEEDEDEDEQWTMRWRWWISSENLVARNLCNMRKWVLMPIYACSNRCDDIMTLHWKHALFMGKRKHFNWNDAPYDMCRLILSKKAQLHMEGDEAFSEVTCPLVWHWRSLSFNIQCQRVIIRKWFCFRLQLLKI